MLAARITPRVVIYGLITELILLTALYLPVILGLTPRFRLTEAIVMTVAGLFAYGIAALLSLEIAAEYMQNHWARVAWLLLAANAAISLLKRAAGSPLFDFVTPDYRISPLRGLLDNTLVVPANLCLLAGLLAMWWALHRLGLGFKIEPRDYAVMAGIAALFLALLIYRENLSQGQSPYLMSRVLQPFGLSLLGVISAFGLVLHRYAVQMGDGRLAAVMRWLMIYVLLRGTLVLLRSIIDSTQPLALDSPSGLSGLDDWAIDMLWQVVHWTAAIATAYRAHLTVNAARQLKELRSKKATPVAA